MKLKLGTAIALLIFTLLFAAQNATLVEFRLLFWKFELARSALILITLSLGIVIGWLAHTVYRTSRRKADA